MNRVTSFIRRFTLTAFALFIGAAAVFGLPASAQATSGSSPIDRLERTKNQIYQGGQVRSFPQIVGGLIQAVLGFVGVVLLFYVIYGGYLWMTAAGDDSKVGKGKKVITNAVIGIMIISIAYFVTTFIVNQIVFSSTGQNLQGQTGGLRPCETLQDTNCR